jgi:hypothetical protein
MSALRKFLIIALLALLSGCQEKDLAAYIQQPLTISVFKGGHLVSERHISPPSGDHERLVSWLTQHKDGWHRSYVTYAPHVLVSGTNFTMNIQHSGVVINAGGRQLVRDASDSDFQFLLHEPGT